MAVGGERTVLPVSVFAELGLLTGRSGDAAGDDPQVGRPGGQLVAAGPAQHPGQLRHLRLVPLPASRYGPEQPVFSQVRGTFQFSDTPKDEISNVDVNTQVEKWTSSKPRAATNPWMSATKSLVIGSISAVDA